MDLTVGVLPMMRRFSRVTVLRSSLVLALGSSLVTAGVAQAGSGAGSSPPEEAAGGVVPSPRRPLPERVPEAGGAPVTGEVPEEILDAVRADLGTRIGAHPSEMKVVRAEEAVFNDGSLGCGQPGQKYTQAAVPGYRVILDCEGKQYDYRVSRRGSLILCERGTRPR